MASPLDVVLPIISVIDVKTDACFVENAYGSYNGTCYVESECQELGGKTVGYCANKLAVCCICKFMQLVN